MSAARGRPRDAARHSAVLAATVELLREIGYEQLTIAAVARRAGVGRQLVYQWWGSKAPLVAEALFLRDRGVSREYPGPFADDLRALVEEMVENFSRPEVLRGLPGLRTDLMANPALLADVNGRVTNPVLARYKRVVRAGIERGDVRPDVRGADIFDILRGAVLLYVQTHPRQSRRQITETFVDLLMHGLTP